MDLELKDPELLFDRQDLMIRLDGDMELAGELVVLFVEDMEKKRAALRSAIDRKDAASVEREGHSLKGAAANLSAGAVRDLSCRIEIAGRDKDLEAAERVYAALVPVIAQTAHRLRKEILAGS